MAAKARSTTPSPSSDAYVGILAVSLLAQLIGVLFFFLDWNQYDKPAPKQVPALAPLTTGTTPPAGGGTP